MTWRSVVLHPFELEALSQEKLTRIRRPVEPQPEHRWNEELRASTLYICEGNHPRSLGCDYRRFAECPLGDKEESFHILEAWTQDLPHGCNTCDGSGHEIVGYRVDGAVHQCTITIWPDPSEYTVTDFNEHPEWQPAETLPVHLSRFTLRVVDIEVEHLNDADPDKLFDEGCPDHYRNVGKHKPKAWLKRTWAEHYPNYPTNTNPYCWVVTVVRV